MKSLCLLILVQLSLYVCAEEKPLPKLDKREGNPELHALTGRQEQIILGQGLIRECQSGRALSDAELIERLKEKTNLVVDTKTGTLDRELAIYLLAYFQVMGIRFSEPVTVKMGMGESPILVQQKEGGLVFSSNAGENLFTKKLGEETKKPHDLREGELQFNNTLFEQLTTTFANRDFVREFLVRHFGIDIEADPNSDESRYARKLTDREAVMVLKQLIDLPLWVTRELKLKRIIRMQPGFTLKDTAADYQRGSELIRLMDKAFTNGPVEGEGVMIHEIGHAYWAKLDERFKIRFIELSWDANRKPKVGTSNFVSDYARKNPEEDFAETFSTFVNAPEKLKRIAPEKYQLLKEDIFGSEFFSGGSKKAKIFVPSDNPDSEPPYFKGKIEDLIEVTAETLKRWDEVEIKCVVKQLFDDISGFTSGSIDFRDKNSDFYCYISFDYLHCKDKTAGLYVFSKRYSLSDFPPNAELKMTAIHLKDRADNYTTITAPPLVVKINGTAKPKKRGTESLPSRVIEMEAIAITPYYEKVMNRQEFKVWIPFNLKNIKQVVGGIRINWAHEKRTDYQIDHSISERDTPYHHKVINGKEGFEFTVFFPSHMESGQLSLSSMYVNLRETSGFKEEYIRINFPKDLKNLKIDVKSSKPDSKFPEMAINDLKISVKTLEERKQNKSGGNTNLVVSVPVAGIDGGDFYIVIRSPSGKRISTSASAYTFKNEPFAIEIPLSPNPEKGEYIIESISVKKQYPSSFSYSPYSAFGTINNEQEIKLLERGIKRSFNISE